MGAKKTIATTLKGIDKELHNSIKREAIKRDVRINDLYLKIVSSGAKRLGIV